MFLGAVQPRVTARKSSLKRIMLPIKGWNTALPYSDMDEDYAVVMDNVFSYSRRLTTRGGHESYSTGMTGNVETLFVYNPEDGNAKMFAANDGKIYDITAGGAVGAAVKSALSSDQWQYVNVGTSGGHFIFACNGADTALTYNGTTWANTTLTGPTTTALVTCNLHQRRLWVMESNSLSAWYGGTDAITGAFTEFPMSAIANMGGHLMGMATWTRDAGDGQDDVAVFVTSEGQAIIYSGTDPSSASTWSLVGVFRIGKPIGRRFYIKAGGDLVLITEDGFVSLSNVLGKDRSQVDSSAISAQINSVVNEAARLASGNFGWQAVLYPRGKMLVFNVPLDGDTSHQYVFNTLTKAPCRFTGMDANCWTTFDDNLFFGGKDGKVYKADTGTNDNGSNIDCVVIPAFNEFNDGGLVKIASLAKIIFEAEGDVAFAFQVFKNYLVPEFIDVSAAVASSSSLWDSAIWDSSVWGGETIREYWRGVNGRGHALALGISLRPGESEVSITDLKLMFQTGGALR